MSSVGDFTIKVVDGWDSKLDDDIKAALEAVGLQAEGYAKLELENPPRRIDTGRLRNSITHAMDGDVTVCIGTAVEYAPYVHEGTMRMTPNRFLKNAMEKNKNQYKKMIESYLAQ